MNKKMWIGRALSAFPIFVLGMSAFMKTTKSPELLQGMASQGIPESLIMTIFALELLSVVLYAIPKTAVVGAILVTGYMGGAIFSHLRIGEGVMIQAIVPIIAWAGLYLRDERLKNLMPLRK